MCIRYEPPLYTDFQDISIIETWPFLLSLNHVVWKKYKPYLVLCLKLYSISLEQVSMLTKVYIQGNCGRVQWSHESPCSEAFGLNLWESGLAILLHWRGHWWIPPEHHSQLLPTLPTARAHPRSTSPLWHGCYHSSHPRRCWGSSGPQEQWVGNCSSCIWGHPCHFVRPNGGIVSSCSFSSAWFAIEFKTS